MKKKIILILFYTFLVGCQSSNSLKSTNETFKKIGQIEVDRLNDDIYAKKITSYEGVVELYEPKQQEKEGNYNYQITKRVINEQYSEVTIIETGLLDDSLEGKKIVFLIMKNNNGIEVISIKENYKCNRGRGHKEWKADKCN